MDIQKYTSLLEQFGKRLKQIRKHKGKTQLDIEVYTGINNGDISRIENGKTNIEFITIAKFAEALNVEMYDLFHYDAPLPGLKGQSKRNKISFKRKKTSKKNK
jgi:transcriptional regulator with XRE-family HTH domain